MFTINYVDDDINIDDLSVAETVNYTSNATVKTSKKKTKKKKYDAGEQNKKSYKSLKRRINEKNKQANIKKKKRQKDDDVVFVEQVPLQPQGRLKKKTRIKTNPSTQ